MMHNEWELELVEALEGTGWEIAWPGVERNTTTCFAEAIHARTKAFRPVRLSYSMFRTKDERRHELLRQLDINIHRG